ncbi:hypothetical protein IFO70_08845 [Phormidium tenue FACHB-886]|nr:hypothetical protein [Phormidium tenue FACHB-886]
MSNKKLVSFRLPDDLMNNLRARADHDGISVTELVCRFLWQGLDDKPAKPEIVDHRIASLEAEVQELRQTKQATPPVAPTPLYALLTQNSIAAHDSTNEVKTRLTRLEKMMEVLLQNAPNASLALPHTSDPAAKNGPVSTG